MSVSLSIDIRDGASPNLRRFLDRIENRKALHLLVGNRVRNRVRDHLLVLSTTRHKTASRLGAAPSGFLGKAAEKVGRAPVQDRGDAVAISLNHPGLARAFRDVEIKPGPGKTALTIPVHASAYNRRAYRVEGLFVAKVEDKAFLGLKSGEGLRLMYLLVPRVLQKQDRTLLPSDREIADEARQGVADYVALLRLSQRNPA